MSSRRRSKLNPVQIDADVPLIRLSDRHARNLTWLWHQRIPLGKSSLLVGDPDSGKSFLALDLAARVSCGLGVPPEPGLPKPASSLLLCADDDIDDTIVPRLEAADADLSRIALLPRVGNLSVGEPAPLISLAKEATRIRAALKKLPGCRLVIIDPITAYLRNGDCNHNQTVRRLLQDLDSIAREKNVAVLLISHLRKTGAANAMYRAIGSTAFTAVARVVLTIANDPAVEGRRLLLPAKMTLRSAPTGRAFRIEDGRLQWEPELLFQSAGDLQTVLPARDPKSDPRREAKKWLIAQLTEKPLPAELLQQRAREHRIPWMVLWSAKRDAQVRAYKDGQQNRWYWKLPDNWIPDVADFLPVVI
jgi:KaiC/GvpD/RAD55 family RecA-like ATPase